MSHGEGCPPGLARLRPDLVINAAAYTAVDGAETEPERAMAINGRAPGFLAEECAALGVPLIHLSTDYVFSGQGDRPWRETDPVGPTGVYGQSKWMGEEAIRNRLEQHLILRTAWVFGRHGENFVKTMVRLGRTQQALRVVTDQVGCPTAAEDLARMLLAISERVRRDPLEPNWGTYHYAGTPPVSRLEFAQAIFRHAVPDVLPQAPVLTGIPSRAYASVARRPLNSVLDCGLIRQRFGIEAPAWEPALARVLGALGTM